MVAPLRTATKIGIETESDQQSKTAEAQGKMISRKLTRRWYAIQLASGGKVPERAGTFINGAAIRNGQRWEVFIPLAASIKIAPEAVNWTCVLRYPPYIFATWPDDAPWAELLSDDAQRAGIVDILRDGEGRPRPAPEKAYQAMRRYSLSKPSVHGSGPLFQPGEPVFAYLAPGHPQEAIFIGYERGRGRPIVRIWILGRENDVPLPAGAIQPKGQKTSKREDDGPQQYQGLPLHPFR